MKTLSAAGRRIFQWRILLLHRMEKGCPPLAVVATVGTAEVSPLAQNLLNYLADEHCMFISGSFLIAQGWCISIPSAG